MLAPRTDMLWVPVFLLNLSPFYVRAMHSPHILFVALWRKVLMRHSVDRAPTNQRQCLFASNALKLRQIPTSISPPAQGLREKKKSSGQNGD